MARWNVVPHQRITGRFEVGVVAFHIHGIDRVVFTVNDREIAVRDPSLNPRTQTVEYWFTFDPNEQSTGPMTIGATVIPKRGKARQLEGPMTDEHIPSGSHGLALVVARPDTASSVVYASATGDDETGDGSSQNPYRTILRAAHAMVQHTADGCDGGTVYLMPGDYRLGPYSAAVAAPTQHAWLTVTAAPGVAPQQVRIVGSERDGLRTKLLRLAGVTVAPTEPGAALQSNWPMHDMLWLDHCRLQGPGRVVSMRWSDGWSAVFATNLTIENARDGLTTVLQRNVEVRRIGSDAFGGRGLIVNCSARDIDRGESGLHPDVLQCQGEVENLIVYGLDATGGHIRAQGFFAGRGVALRDVALVDCQMDNRTRPGHPMRVFQVMGPTNNLYIRHCRFAGPSQWRVDEGFSATNVVVEASRFGNRRPLVPRPLHVTGVTVRHHDDQKYE